MNRRNFDRRTAAEIAKRDRSHTGEPWCHDCHAVGVKLALHHWQQDAMVSNEEKASKKLTVDDGAMLCEPCHAVYSKQQAADLAKAERVEAKHLGTAAAPQKPLVSRGFAKVTKRERPPLRVAAGVSEIARRYGGGSS